MKRHHRLTVGLMFGPLAFVLLAVLAAPRPLAGASGPKTISMTISPAPLPVPAHEYRLLPSLLDQSAGNAEPILSTAAVLVANLPEVGETQSRMGDWLDLPPDQMPIDEVRKVLDGYSEALRYAGLGARRDWCVLDAPLREEGVNALLPSLLSYRRLARALTLRARVEILDGHYDQALADLQTNLNMARFVGSGPTVIHTMVGSTMALPMLDEVRHFMGRPKTPNLYWALASVPQPLVDWRVGMEWEQNWLFFEFPQLQTIHEGPLTPQQADQIVERMIRLAKTPVGSETSEPYRNQWKDRPTADATISEILPQAKAYLLERGYAEQQLAAMPAPQIVAMYSLDRFIWWRDELFKWFDVPYWKGFEPMRQTELKIQAIQKDLSDGAPFVALLPKISQVFTVRTRVDRTLAALRCLEAIRLYATTHEGKLPKTLEEVTEVPIPLDPMTGKSFRYTNDAKTASLELTEPSDDGGLTGCIIEVTIRP